jgi:hypothetical protein
MRRLCFRNPWIKRVVAEMDSKESIMEGSEGDLEATGEGVTVPV